jgi:hypothetical protein
MQQGLSIDAFSPLGPVWCGAYATTPCLTCGGQIGRNTYGSKSVGGLPCEAAHQTCP